MNYRGILVSAVAWTLVAGFSAAEEEPVPGAMAALGAPLHPKVDVVWTRYYDTAGIEAIARRMTEAHPDLCRLRSIGTSFGGRDLWMIEVTDFMQGGDPDRKPGFYIDGNIHGNEVQGAEVALYTAWYLTEMHGQVRLVSELLRDRVFYIVPTINPDARDYFLTEPSNPHEPRSGLIPRDDDGDGLTDEDGPEDLDGDGHIVQMRVRDPDGRWKPDPEDPRLMVRCRPEEAGEYRLVGEEGFDNDGDGDVNEDGLGSYDPNRDWGWLWEPNYVQWGADRYPFSLPETRAVADFVIAHPNLAGAQSYRNAGGMILRGPGVKGQDLDGEDARVFDAIAEIGERQLPGYRSQVVWKDLYTVYGGEFDWFYGARGIVTFSNELWTAFNFFRKSDEGRGWFGSQKEAMEFDRRVLLEEAFVPWHEVDHPQYGRVEVGGIKKSLTRIPPAFLLPEECHRNMAFTLYHAYQLPRIVIRDVEVKDLPGGLRSVTATVANERLTPTRTAQDRRHGIVRPDILSLDGEGLRVLAGFLVEDRFPERVVEQKRAPARLEVASIRGKSAVTVRWIVEGEGAFTVRVDSVRGGMSAR